MRLEREGCREWGCALNNGLQDWFQALCPQLGRGNLCDEGKKYLLWPCLRVLGYIPWYA